MTKGQFVTLIDGVARRRRRTFQRVRREIRRDRPNIQIKRSPSGINIILNQLLDQLLVLRGKGDKPERHSGCAVAYGIRAPDPLHNRRALEKDKLLGQNDSEADDRTGAQRFAGVDEESALGEIRRELCLESPHALEVEVDFNQIISTRGLTAETVVNVRHDYLIQPFS